MLDGSTELVLSLVGARRMVARTDSRSSYSSQKAERERRTIKPTKANLLFIRSAFKKKGVIALASGWAAFLTCPCAYLLNSLLLFWIRSL